MFIYLVSSMISEFFFKFIISISLSVHCMSYYLLFLMQFASSIVGVYFLMIFFTFVSLVISQLQCYTSRIGMSYKKYCQFKFDFVGVIVQLLRSLLPWHRLIKLVRRETLVMGMLLV